MSSFGSEFQHVAMTDFSFIDSDSAVDELSILYVVTV